MRMALIAALGLLLTTVSGVAAQATSSGVTTQILSQGDIDFSDAVGGPATVYIGSIDMPPGTTYAGWHTHPGPVWVVVRSGELALYGPDGGRTSYAEGMAYLAQPQTAYHLPKGTGQPA